MKNTNRKQRQHSLSQSFFFLFGGIAILETLVFLWFGKPLQSLGLLGISLLFFPPFEKKLIEYFQVDLCNKRRDIALFFTLFLFFLGTAAQTG